MRRHGIAESAVPPTYADRVPGTRDVVRQKRTILLTSLVTVETAHRGVSLERLRRREVPPARDAARSSGIVGVLASLAATPSAEIDGMLGRRAGARAAPMRIDRIWRWAEAAVRTKPGSRRSLRRRARNGSPIRRRCRRPSAAARGVRRGAGSTLAVPLVAGDVMCGALSACARIRRRRAAEQGRAGRPGGGRRDRPAAKGRETARRERSSEGRDSRLAAGARRRRRSVRRHHRRQRPWSAFGDRHTPGGERRRRGRRELPRRAPRRRPRGTAARAMPRS